MRLKKINLHKFSIISCRHFLLDCRSKSIYLSLFLSFFFSFYLPIHPFLISLFSFFLFIYFSIVLSIYLSIYLCIFLSIYLSILSIYPLINYGRVICIFFVKLKENCLYRNLQSIQEERKEKFVVDMHFNKLFMFCRWIFIYIRLNMIGLHTV